MRTRKGVLPRGTFFERALNVPIDELRGRLHEVPRDRVVAVYCQVGQRGYLAARILKQAGYTVVNLGGGYKTYKLWNPRS